MNLHPAPGAFCAHPALFSRHTHASPAAAASCCDSRVRTLVGTIRGATSPCPSCPNVLYPQVYTAPRVESAMVCSAPALISRTITPSRDVIRFGRLRSTSSLSPSCCLALAPNATTPPSWPRLMKFHARISYTEYESPVADVKPMKALPSVMHACALPHDTMSRLPPHCGSPLHMHTSSMLGPVAHLYERMWSRMSKSTLILGWRGSSRKISSLNGEYTARSSWGAPSSTSSTKHVFTSCNCASVQHVVGWKGSHWLSGFHAEIARRHFQLSSELSVVNGPL
mmetsp:Transcript_50672/g.120667  ORF Transcript_50672/g.120667 Transcript_50672/m.120667 type:complete len:282 (-) Transcript_50672:1189-2034(-)